MIAVPTPPAEPLAVNAAQAAQMISVSQRTLWGLTAPRGPIPAARINRRVVYRVADLDAYLCRLAGESTSASTR
jgi:hypothetical protein